MTRWKLLALFFGLMTFGGIQEIISIKNEPEYEPIQGDLIPVAFGMTTIFACAAIYFWFKESGRKNKIQQ